MVSDPTKHNKIRLWDLEKGQSLGDGGLGDELPRTASFSPDGKNLAGIFDQHALVHQGIRIRLWDITLEGTLANERNVAEDDPSHWEPVYHASFSPDGSIVAAGTMGRELVYIWDAKTGEVKRRFQGGVAVAFTPDGRTLLAVTHDGEVRRFDTATWKFLGHDLSFRRNDYILVSHAVFSPDGKRVALGDGWTTLVKDVITSQTLCRINLPTLSFPSSFSVDGQTLAVAGEQGDHFFDTTTGAERGWLKRSEGRGTFLANGKHLACLKDRSIAIRDVKEVLDRPERRPTPELTEPGAASLEAQLIANQDTYALDLGGDSVEDYSIRILIGEKAPEPPQVDLTVALHNNGKETINLVGTERSVLLYLVGPGALSRYFELRQTGVGDPRGDRVTLPPGATHTFRVTTLRTSNGYAFWLLPGEYLIGGEYLGAASRFAPVKVKVVPGNQGREPGPAAAAYEIRRPPLPGTVIAPHQDDGSERTKERLASPANFRGLAPPMPFQEVVEFLGDRYGLDIRVDEGAFRTADMAAPGEVLVVCPPLRDVSLFTVLQIVLDQAGARMEIRGRTVWILPQVKPQCLAERLHPASRHFKERLEKPVTLEEIEAGTPLSEALKRVAEQCDLNFVIDKTSFEKYRVKDIDRKVTRMAKRTEIRLRSVLDELLLLVDATFVVRNGIVVIIPMEAH